MFKFGDYVCVSNDGGQWEDTPRKFVTHVEGLEYPYITYSEALDFRNFVGHKYAKRCLPGVKIDTPVWVRDQVSDRWRRRHSAGWTDDGKMLCWSGGGTSHTTDNTTIWVYYSLEEPKK